MQNPFAFEFTDQLLIELYHSVCYCYHHTFAFNDVEERLQAIQLCPKNLLMMSAFDFSLYLYSDIYRLLRNEASVFSRDLASDVARFQTRRAVGELLVSNPTNDRSPSTTPRTQRRNTYQIETPKTIPLVLDIPISNGSTSFQPEQYEYDRIECPQIFTSDLHVDWRTVTLELWSQCYCRYDQNYLPTLTEQQLIMDIHRSREESNKKKNRSKRNVTLDSFHFVCFH